MPEFSLLFDRLQAATFQSSRVHRAITIIVALLSMSSQRLYAQLDSAAFITFPMGPGNLWQYRMPPPTSDPTIYEEKSDKDTTENKPTTQVRTDHQGLMLTVMILTN